MSGPSGDQGPVTPAAACPSSNLGNPAGGKLLDAAPRRQSLKILSLRTGNYYSRVSLTQGAPNRNVNVAEDQRQRESLDVRRVRTWRAFFSPATCFATSGRRAKASERHA